MTNAAIEKKLARMQADIEKLKRHAQTSSVVEKARARLRAEIMRGIASGPGIVADKNYWKKKRAWLRTLRKSK